MLRKTLLVVSLLIVPFVSIAQSSSAIDAFTKFVSKNYRLPEELKTNCEWMYAIVKVRTDNHNKIIKYKVVNNAPKGIKDAFNFLVGYQFPKKMKINGHPIVFYMGIDNLEACTEKPGDKIFYAPNDAASKIWSYMTELFKDEPNTIFISNLLLYGYSLPQQ
jgi:hypothetical protein